MPEGEHSEKGVVEGETPRQRMIVRWGRAHFEDIMPGDPDYLETDAAAEGDSQPEGNQPSPEPGAGPDTNERRRAGGERRLDVIRRQRRLKLALVLLVALDGVLLVDRFTEAEDPFLLTTPPPSILGTWVTENPVYSGTSFVISDQVFEVRTSEGGNNRFWIRSLRGEETEATWRFEITYTSPEEGDMNHIFFLYADGTARLNNPPDVVWTRL